MNKKHLFLGMSVCLLILGLALSGCDNGTTGSGGGSGTPPATTGIAAKWQGRYNAYDDPDYIILKATTATGSINGQSNETAITAGTVGKVKQGDNEVGDWVQLVVDGTIHGFVVDISVAMTISGTSYPPGTHIGLGTYQGKGALELKTRIKNAGLTFSPEPSNPPTSGTPADYYFLGTK